MSGRPFCSRERCGHSRPLHLFGTGACAVADCGCAGYSAPIRSDFGRFAAYARAHGRTSVDQMTVDRSEFGEQHTLAGYVGWLTIMRARFEVERDVLVEGPERIAEFDAWLSQKASATVGEGA